MIILIGTIFAKNCKQTLEINLGHGGVFLKFKLLEKGCEWELNFVKTIPTAIIWWQIKWNSSVYLEMTFLYFIMNKCKVSPR